MKKALIPILTILLVFVLINSAEAVTVTVTCSPGVIPYPGGTTTITVSSDEAGSGSITVITPGGSSSVCPITVPAGGSDSKEYPTDFPGGSTSELGEYEVTVSLLGDTWKAIFWVTFTVIPESPIGTLMAVIASFGALALTAIKRPRLRHQPT